MMARTGSDPRIPVAVLGATGVVGQHLMQRLRGHPWFELTEVVGSQRRVGSTFGSAVEWVVSDEPPEEYRHLTLSSQPCILYTRSPKGLKRMFKRMPDAQPRLADDVYDQILSAIVNGQIVPGERLIQEKIALEINISRTPVREALLRLEQEGVLELSGRKGFAIRQVSESEVRDLYGAREAVEGYGAYWVAGNRTPEHLTAIEARVDAEQALNARDVEAEFQLNRDIHRTIVAQTGNNVLLDMFDSIWGRGISLWLFAATRANQDPPDPDVHRALLGVISTGTPEAAQAAMVGHIREGLARQIKGL